MSRRFGVVGAVSLVAVLAMVASFVGFSAAAGGHSRVSHKLLKFDVMAGVVEPFTGATNPVRGVNGGGLPWELRRAFGSLRSDGRLKITVRGLVLARRDPVPPALQGTTPVAQFRGAVNCLTPAAPATGETVLTDPFAATTGGDASIKARVVLPQPCIAPIVFVTSPDGAWFAATG